MTAADDQAHALRAIAHHTVEARRTGDLHTFLANVEHELSSLIVQGSVPQASVVRVDRHHITVNGSEPVVASASAEAKVRAMTHEQRERFRQIMGR